MVTRPEPTLEYPNTYTVTVDVRYEFEVEADSYEQAEEMGFYYEEYSMYADVQSVDVSLETEFCQVCGSDIEDEHCIDEEA